MTAPGSPLVLGPMLRYVDTSEAAVWVEVARPGRVTVEADGREHTADTFAVHGHHYALVDVLDLKPGQAYPYTVTFDGEQVWPPPESTHPPSRIRTIDPGGRLRIAFGSCRTSVPHDAAANAVHGPDVLRALSKTLADERADWPALLLLLGDQVYADETSEEMRVFIAARRDIDEPPGAELRDYDEYAHLYQLAWTDPDVRWLLSTLPSAMIFDDHDVRDDWNTSAAWRAQMQRTSWWQLRIVSALASYWVYQHLGNLSRAEREADPVWRKIVEAGRAGDAGDLLDDVADRADADPETYRWSFHRDIGRTRLVVVDSRAARVLDESNRHMVDRVEREWLADLLTGDVDHLLIGSSLPYLLPPGLHHLEAWNEAVAGGAWGKQAARVAERIRQKVDLEHWAAFQNSFQVLARRVVEIATGKHGDPPATVMFLSGDVHHSYVADVRLEGGSSHVLQAVCSPIRNPLPRWARWGANASIHWLSRPLGWLASRTTQVPAAPFEWSITDGPWFDNAIATLDVDGRRADLRWETADADATLQPLHTVRVA